MIRINLLVFFTILSLDVNCMTMSDNIGYLELVENEKKERKNDYEYCQSGFPRLIQNSLESLKENKGQIRFVNLSMEYRRKYIILQCVRFTYD